MNVYEIVTQKIIEKLENGVLPWHKPWTAHKPCNFASKREYNGINLMLLDGEDPRYMTFPQVKEKGGSIKKGAKAYMVVFWSPIKAKTITIKDEDTGEEETLIDGKTLGKFMLRYYTVFNAVDIEGIEFPPLPINENVCQLEEAQSIADAYIEQLRSFGHGGDRAYYAPFSDHVQMPTLESFHSSEEYYSTLFHELGHSTGHESRLNRHSQKEFDSHRHNYSYEELVAEMTACFLCAHVGITNTLDNSASYLKGWASVLSKKENQRFVVIAAGQAQKASDFILRFSTHVENSNDVAA
ncbi:MAG: DUF1738 domain-containing protein [Erysipelotrichia bacterium]|nr:DUF1738 domain-containing protein [Erysipelotrichia bacterium]